MHVYVVLVWEHEFNMPEHVAPSWGLIDFQVANIDSPPIDGTRINFSAPIPNVQIIDLENPGAPTSTEQTPAP
jgi:hypothetical protein